MSGFNQHSQHAKFIENTLKPVEITDIVVSQISGAGEFNLPSPQPYSNEDRVKRMGDFVELLATIGNKEHEQEHFETIDGKTVMKDDCTNKVMRLTTNEFSLYPKDTPLSIDEYNTLLKRIGNIAENCHENFQLVLGSVAVMGLDNQVHNIVVHVQCGKPAILNNFAKFVPSPIDAVYPDVYNPSFIGKGVMPNFLDRKTGPQGYPQLSYNEIISRIRTRFDELCNGVNFNNTWYNVSNWVNHVQMKLSEIKDPNYLPPDSLTQCVDNLANSLNNVWNTNAAKALIPDFAILYNEMNTYYADSSEKNKKFRKSIDNPVTTYLKPDKVHIADFGKYKMAFAPKSQSEIVQSIGQCLLDPDKHQIALAWLNEMRKNLLPSDVLLNSAINDLEKKIKGDDYVTSVHNFKKELDNIINMFHTPPITMVNLDQISQFKNKYQDIIIEVQNTFDQSQRDKITSDVKPVFDAMFEKAHYSRLINFFEEDFNKILTDYNKNTNDYKTLIMQQKDRLEELTNKYNIIDNKVIAIIEQCDLILDKINKAEKLEANDVALFTTNKGELDDALKSMRKNSAITEQEIEAFSKAKDTLEIELNKSILNGTTKNDLNITNDLAQKVQDYQQTNFITNIDNELKQLCLAWEANKNKPEFKNKFERALKVLSNVKHGLPENRKIIVDPVLKALLDNRVPSDLEVQTFINELRTNKPEMDKLKYTTFPLGTSHDIVYDPAVLCTTAGQSKFYTYTQICLDHIYDTVQRSMKNTEQLESGMPKSTQVSHILNSNSVSLEIARTFTEYVTHADITINKMGVTHIDSSNNVTKINSIPMKIDTSALNVLDTAIYGYTQINKKNGPDEIEIDSPPFGPEKCILRKYPSHSLSPLPLNNNTLSSKDNFTANYYINKLETILHACSFTLFAEEQNACKNQFLTKLSLLKNKPNTTVQEFYNLLKEFNDDVSRLKKDKEEEHKPEKEYNIELLQQIKLMTHYLDTNVISPEVYIKFRILDLFKQGNSLKQDSIINDFSDVMINQLKNVNLRDPASIDFIANKIFGFKEDIYSITDENTDNLISVCDQIEKYMKQNHPQVYEKLDKLHEDHAKLGKNKLCEDYYQKKFAEINQTKSNLQREVNINNSKKRDWRYRDKEITPHAPEIVITSAIDNALKNPLQPNQQLALETLKDKMKITHQEAEKYTEGKYPVVLSGEIAEALAEFKTAADNDKLGLLKFTYLNIEELLVKEYPTLLKVLRNTLSEGQLKQKYEVIENLRTEIRSHKTQIEDLVAKVPLLKEELRLNQEKAEEAEKLLKEETKKLNIIKEEKLNHQKKIELTDQRHQLLITESLSYAETHKDNLLELTELQENIKVAKKQISDLQNDRTIVESQRCAILNDLERINLELESKLEQSSKNEVEIEQRRDFIENNKFQAAKLTSEANKIDSTCLDLKNQMTSYNDKYKKLNDDINDCVKQIADFQHRLETMGPENENNKKDIQWAYDQINDYTKRIAVFQTQQQKYIIDKAELAQQLSTLLAEQSSIQNQIKKLALESQEHSLNIETLHSNLQLLSNERKTLLEQQKLTTELLHKAKDHINEIDQRIEIITERSSSLSNQLLQIDEKLQLSAKNVAESEKSVAASNADMENLNRIKQEIIEKENMQDRQASAKQKEFLKLNEIAESGLVEYNKHVTSKLKLENELPGKVNTRDELMTKMEKDGVSFDDYANQKERNEQQKQEAQAKTLRITQFIHTEVDPRLNEAEQHYKNMKP